jgi:hypothetical protein
VSDRFPFACDLPLVGRGGLTVFAASTAFGRARIQELEAVNGALEQVPIVTYHLLHGRMYARSCRVPADMVLTGARIKIPTIVILEGDATVTDGEDVKRLVGYHVIAARADRQQAYAAHLDTHLTMIFPTRAGDVEAAEREFTDDAERLMSRRGANVVEVTGD